MNKIIGYLDAILGAVARTTIKIAYDCSFQEAKKK